MEELTAGDKVEEERARGQEDGDAARAKNGKEVIEEEEIETTPGGMGKEMASGNGDCNDGQANLKEMVEGRFDDTVERDVTETVIRIKTGPENNHSASQIRDENMHGDLTGEHDKNLNSKNNEHEDAIINESSGGKLLIEANITELGDDKHECGDERQILINEEEKGNSLNSTDHIEESYAKDNSSTGLMEDVITEAQSIKTVTKHSSMLKPPVKEAPCPVGNSNLKVKRTKFKPPHTKSANSVASSIDINITELIERDACDDVTMATRKSTEFSLHTVFDDPEEELACAINNSDRMSISSDIHNGRAAATNTPVESNLHHRSLHTPVRDNIYEHAIHLIKNRCSSRTTGFSSRCLRQCPSVWEAEVDEGDDINLVSLPTLLSKINEPPFKSQPNKSFFIAQQRPIPLEPLQVWKGYHGNVFFQPLICRKMKMSVLEKAPISSSTVSSPARKADSSDHLSSRNSRFPHLNREQTNLRAATARTWNGRSNLIPTEPRNGNSALGPGSRQMSVLDRGAVLSRLDQHFGEDISWLNGIEALGALQLGRGRTRSSSHFYDNRGGHHKLRIHRGLVSHKQATLLKENQALDVSGGRITSEGSHGQRIKEEEPSSHAVKTLPSERKCNGRQVVVDLSVGSEIVKEYLAQGGGISKLIQTNSKNQNAIK